MDITTEDKTWLKVFERLVEDKDKICIQATFRDGKRVGKEEREVSFSLGELMIFLTVEGIKFQAPQ